jgi:hypothetical protein
VSVEFKGGGKNEIKKEKKKKESILKCRGKEKTKI